MASGGHSAFDASVSRQGHRGGHRGSRRGGRSTHFISRGRGRENPQYHSETQPDERDYSYQSSKQYRNSYYDHGYYTHQGRGEKFRGQKSGGRRPYKHQYLKDDNTGKLTRTC